MLLMKPAQNPPLSRIKLTHFCRCKGKDNEKKTLDLSIHNQISTPASSLSPSSTTNKYVKEKRYTRLM